MNYTKHAHERMAEFGLSEDQVDQILVDFENRWTDPNGQATHQLGEWAAVTGILEHGPHRGEEGVITVLRRTLDRWEHQPPPLQLRSGMIIRTRPGFEGPHGRPRRGVVMHDPMRIGDSWRGVMPPVEGDVTIELAPGITTVTQNRDGKWGEVPADETTAYERARSVGYIWDPQPDPDEDLEGYLPMDDRDIAWHYLMALLPPATAEDLQDPDNDFPQLHDVRAVANHIDDLTNALTGALTNPETP